jgi:RNA polymerase sigma-70 factor, ECF subfamily
MRPSDSIALPVAAAASCADVAKVDSARVATRMDEAAFQALYRETAPALRSYLRRACGDAALADDLLQETFYRFLRAEIPADFEPFQTKAYLYRTASSLAADHWRRVKRERRWSFEGIIEPRTEKSDGSGEAMAIFRKMKPREQTLVWLAYVEGFDHREIASTLRISERSVRVLLYRVRRKLGRILRKHGLGPKEGT